MNKTLTNTIKNAKLDNSVKFPSIIFQNANKKTQKTVTFNDIKIN